MKLIPLIAFSTIISTAAHSCDLAWPDPSIPVPNSVRTFVASECNEFKGWGDETVDECITRELYGFRAVVEMLMHEELGELAAARYRGCAAGLGKLGGKFHRRKADCISRAYSVVWRFEYSEEASGLKTRKADLDADPPSVRQARALKLAMAMIDGN